jgi:hypothetical protein
MYIYNILFMSTDYFQNKTSTYLLKLILIALWYLKYDKKLSKQNFNISYLVT